MHGAGAKRGSVFLHYILYYPSTNFMTIFTTLNTIAVVFLLD